MTGNQEKGFIEAFLVSALYQQLDPQDAIESALAQTIVALNNTTMDCARRASVSVTLPVRALELTYATRCALILPQLTKAFDTHREGKQRGIATHMASGHTRNVGPMLRSPRCGARNRSGSSCRSPAVRGKRRCRMHGGAEGSGAPHGNQNALKHGAYKQEALRRRAEMRELFEKLGSCSRSLVSCSPKQLHSGRCARQRNNPRLNLAAVSKTRGPSICYDFSHAFQSSLAFDFVASWRLPYHAAWQVSNAPDTAYRSGRWTLLLSSRATVRKNSGEQARD